MPALSPTELVNPSTDPATYPGHPIRRDVLVVGSWAYPMAPAPGRRLGAYTVALDGGPLAGRERPTLSAALATLGVPPVAARYAVLAVGSNAAPGQLAHKFAARWVGTVIPVTVTRVKGVTVAHSAHVSAPGYLPYAPCGDPSAAGRLVTLWLDEAQLQRMHETEPNYLPSTLTRDRAAAELSSSEPVTQLITYRSRWGLLRTSARRGPLPATTQEALFAHLGTVDAFADLVPEVAEGPAAAMAALAADPARREATRAGFLARGNRVDDGLGTVGYEPRPYGDGRG